MRPAPDEYTPYHETYISLVQADDIVTALQAQGNETAAMLLRLPPAMADYRYAPDKWTIKQVLGHVTDGERVLAYRALRFARGDRTPLTGYEQDDFMRGANFEPRTLASLIEEFEAVRRSTVLLFASLEPEAWSRRGVANQNEISVRALAWLIAGHEMHHRRALQEKYFRSKTPFAGAMR